MADITKDKKMVRATKITEKFIAELTPAEYELELSEQVVEQVL